MAEETGVPEKTTDLPQVTDKQLKIMGEETGVPKKTTDLPQVTDKQLLLQKE
jgi:hypothetical protein